MAYPRQNLPSDSSRLLLEGEESLWLPQVSLHGFHCVSLVYILQLVNMAPDDCHVTIL